MAARDVTLIATLGGLAAAGRVLFAPIPSVQPVTVLVAAAGVALGPKRGFAVGALAALASNFFLGQGPHTPWQMLAWGGCGLLGGLLAPLLKGRLAFAIFTVGLGFAFGMLMDLWLWYGFYPHTEAAPARAARRPACPSTSRTRPGTSCSHSRPGRSSAACSNASSGARGRRSCGREDPATLAAAPLLATPVGYVQSQQRADGGFGDAQITAWATLGLVAAGAEPERAGGSSRARSPRVDHRGRAVAMARAAAGDRPDDLLARLRAQTPGKLVNATIWSILALRQAGEDVPGAARRRRSAPPSTPPGAGRGLAARLPDTNDTAAAIQALRAVGVTGPPDRPRRRLPPPAPEPGRGLRALDRPGLRRAVDGVGDPGARRRRTAAGRAPRSATSPACAARTAATATRRATRRHRSG